jgi:TRAP-type C4-dicarboxylate transport system permease small subunit
VASDVIAPARAGGGGSRLRRALDALYATCGVLSAACIVGMLLLIVWQVVGRASGLLAAGADDFAAYTLATGSILALSYTLKQRAHIRVTLLTSKIRSTRLRRSFEVLCLAIGVAAALFLTWSSVAFVWESYELHDVATTYYATPLWIPRLGLPIGFAVFAIAMIDELVLAVAGARPPDIDTAAEG